MNNTQTENKQRFSRQQRSAIIWIVLGIIGGVIGSILSRQYPEFNITLVGGIIMTGYGAYKYARYRA